MAAVFSPRMCIRRFYREGHSHLFTLDARYADIGVAQAAVDSLAGLGGRACKGTGYDVGWRFARGGIRTAAVNLVCFGLTIDSTEAERAELIAIISSVAAAMHHPLHPQHLHRSMKDWSMS